MVALKNPILKSQNTYETFQGVEGTLFRLHGAGGEADGSDAQVLLPRRREDGGRGVFALPPGVRQDQGTRLPPGDVGLHSSRTTQGICCYCAYRPRGNFCSNCYCSNQNKDTNMCRANKTWAMF